VAVVGPLLRNPVVRRDGTEYSRALAFPHTYELRPSPDGWLVVVDEKLLTYYKTLPEANLALIRAHARHISARIG
jgi:hypothetical protein